MMKQIVVHSRPVKLYSPDGGHTWSSNPQVIAAYGQRKERLRLELRKRFERIDVTTLGRSVPVSLRHETT